MSDKNDKPAFDEQTLAKVLEAAYVLQEHNREQRERQERAAREVRRAPLVEPVRVPAPAMVAPVAMVSLPPPPPVVAVNPPPATLAEPRPAQEDYSIVLAQIVDTQRQIQSQGLELDRTMALVAERAAEASRADGAAIGMVEAGKVCYRAASGIMAPPIGTEVAMEKALCTACLRIGQVIRCNDVNLEFLVDAEECRRRGIQSLIAAPIYHGGIVVGALELFYQKSQAFHEPDAHTCQLMAGLVSEVMARNEERNWKKSLETERAAVRDALEKLKPNLEALVERPVTREFTTTSAAPAPAPAVVPVALCRKCGSELVEDEQFCGECGTPRSSDYEPASMQTKVALLWQMQEARKKGTPTPVNGSTPSLVPAPPDSFAGERSDADLLVSGLPELFTLPRTPHNESPELDSPEPEPEPAPVQPLDAREATSAVAKTEPAEADGPVERVPVLAPEHHPDWSSAAAARAFLERITNADRHVALARFLRARRADIYLAVAVILVAVVIRWGIWSGHSVSATGNTAAAAHHKPGADLPLYDRMLIKLGMAEAPDPPEYKGNPSAQVWVDTQTALYYCQGSDLYGKTPKGSFRSQRDAQLDSYEPAYRKPCD